MTKKRQKKKRARRQTATEKLAQELLFSRMRWNIDRIERENDELRRKAKW